MSAAQDNRHDDSAAEAGFTILEVLVTLTIFLMVIATVGTTIARRDTTPTPLETVTAFCRLRNRDHRSEPPLENV